MNTWILFGTLAVIVFGNTVVAADHESPQGVILEHAKFDGATATGSCGPAKITITGVETETAYRTKHLIGSSGTITIRAGKATLSIGADGNAGIFLQDQNRLHCVSTPSGQRLVLVSDCFGRGCAPVDYRVINPATAKVISRQNSADECDEACAQKALGSKLPESLGELL